MKRLVYGAERGLLPAFMGLILALSLMAPSAAASNAAFVPPGAFSSAKISQLIATMSPEERGAIGAKWQSGQYAPVAYERIFMPLDSAGRPVTSSATVLPLAGSTSGHGLYISVSATYDYQAPAYRWDLDGFWQWTGGTADSCNQSPDHVSIAWGGQLGLVNDYAYGYYSDNSSIPTYRGTANSNGGVDYYFNEWKSGSPLCTGANWGHLLATISETRLQNFNSGVDFQYTHTYGTVDVGISFSVPPAITVSTGTSYWPLAASTSVTF